MFQRLNNMFVGEINNLPSQEPEFSEKEEEEWILVDFIDTCSNFSMVEEEDDEEEDDDDDIHEASPVDHSPVFSCLPSSLECLADASESCFIQFDSCPMEESWFITPPPCFTAGGLTALKVETSPLENLLIEHPSMSVYAVHNTCHSLNKTSCGDEEEEEEPEPRDASSPRDLMLVESCRIFYPMGHPDPNHTTNNCLWLPQHPRESSALFPSFLQHPRLSPRVLACSQSTAAV